MGAAVDVGVTREQRTGLFIGVAARRLRFWEADLFLCRRSSATGLAGRSGSHWMILLANFALGGGSSEVPAQRID